MATAQRTSIYLFAQDVVDEGIDVVLDRLRDAGLGGVTMAAAYHHSRDVFPHNPRHKVVYLEGGTTYFHPDLSRYAGTRLKPKAAAIAAAGDPLAALVAAANRRQMHVAAWTVFLHNTRLAFAEPECAPLTAFGDRLLNCLCPAHPQVRAYATALASDVARYGVDTIKLEALSYMPFDHGYHHERSFIHLSPTLRFLLGLCFCLHCVAAVQAAGVDGERVRAWVVETVGAVFETSQHERTDTDVDEPWLRSACDGELGRYIDARKAVVTSLVAEVTSAIHAESPSTRVVFLDLSGATLGFGGGQPATEQAAVEIAWRDGVDLAGVATASDGLGALAYFAALDRFEREVAEYQKVLAPGRRLEVVSRPMLPDAASSDALAAKLAVLERLGVDDVAFYHYGFMRLESLHWIARALEAQGSARAPG